MLANVRLVDPTTKLGAYGLVRVDTGDDIAIADPSLIASTGAQPTDQTEVQGIDGQPVQVPLYHLDIDLGAGSYISDMEVMGLNISALGYAGLFGDNLLDHGILVRDGPAQTWSFTGISTPVANPFPTALTIAGVGLAAIVAAALWPRPRTR